MRRVAWIFLGLTLVSCGGSDVPAESGAGGSGGASATTGDTTGTTQTASSSGTDTASVGSSGPSTTTTQSGTSGSSSSSITSSAFAVGSGPGTPSTTGCTGGAGGGGGAGGASNDGGSQSDASVAPPFDAGPLNAGIVVPLWLIRPDAAAVDGGLDPNTQNLIVGTSAFACTKPFADNQCGQWRVMIGVPPSLFTMGVIPLCDPRLLSGFSMREPDRGGGICGDSNGRFAQGTLEILSITDQTVTFRLSKTYNFGYDADGTYAASRCQ